MSTQVGKTPRLRYPILLDFPQQLAATRLGRCWHDQNASPASLLAPGGGT
jgi:hypothetical protein